MIRKSFPIASASCSRFKVLPLLLKSRQTQSLSRSPTPAFSLSAPASVPHTCQTSNSWQIVALVAAAAATSNPVAVALGSTRV